MATNLEQKDLTLSTLQPAILPTAPTIFRPTRAVIPIRAVTSPIITAPVTTTEVAPTTPKGVNPSGSNGIPLVLLTLSAVQTPVKQQSYTNCNVTVEFTYNTADTNLYQVRIWFVGYHGSSTPQLMSSGVVSLSGGQPLPLNFICDATGETVTVYAQTASSTGAAAPVQFAKSCNVTLSGIVAAPPAPTISQSLVGTPTGYQFGFNQVVLPGGDEEVISNYNIYRGTVNSFGSGALHATMVSNPALSGALTYTDTINDATGAAYFYWVTAMNTAGYESTPTPAQSGTVVGSIGSLPPSLSTPFTLVTASTSVTLKTSPSCFFTRADGTKVMVGQTSTACTGLPTGNTAFFFPYWRESDQTLQFVQNTDVSIPTIIYAKFTAASLQYIETTTVGSIPSSFSVEMWVQGTAAGALFDYSAPQVVGTTTASVVQAEVTSAGEIEFSIHNGSTWGSVTTSGASLLDSCFHHIVCTYSAGTGWVYVDGIATSNGSTFWTNASMGTIATTSGSWHFGVCAGLSGAPLALTTYGSFNLSHIALYTTALSGIQAAAHMQAFDNIGETAYLAELTYDSAANLWKLNEGSGTTAFDVIGSNNGTYKASPTLNQSASVITVLGTPTIAWPFNAIEPIQQQNLRNHTPLSNGGISANTSTSGSSSGGGASGGYNPNLPNKPGCFTAETRVKTQRGDIPIAEVIPGDLCLTAKGNWLPVSKLVTHEAEPRKLHAMPCRGLVTCAHKVLVDGQWVPAGSVFLQTVEVDVPVYTITMESTEPLDQMLAPTTERSFTLSNGVVAHNSTFQK